ncbi:hypothetical protein FOZ61_006529 [Perkinsus olseni]|uniref:Uncharacterized protein n=1 Tax=Perkinsus olseni TaxID=32597 RepID=A0A7J6LCN5_PEROL|nr:hypothetical protein FOZ61_006529 [Perkinsus olseni]
MAIVIKKDSQGRALVVKNSDCGASERVQVVFHEPVVDNSEEVFIRIRREEPQHTGLGHSDVEKATMIMNLATSSHHYNIQLGRRGTACGEADGKQLKRIFLVVGGVAKGLIKDAWRQRKEWDRSMRGLTSSKDEQDDDRTDTTTHDIAFAKLLRAAIEPMMVNISRCIRSLPVRDSDDNSIAGLDNNASFRGRHGWGVQVDAVEELSHTAELIAPKGELTELISGNTEHATMIMSILPRRAADDHIERLVRSQKGDPYSTEVVGNILAAESVAENIGEDILRGSLGDGLSMRSVGTVEGSTEEDERRGSQFGH